MAGVVWMPGFARMRVSCDQGRFAGHANDKVAGLRFTIEPAHGGPALIDFVDLKPRSLDLGRWRHSARKAIIGSIAAARRAGRQTARAAVARKIPQLIA